MVGVADWLDESVGTTKLSTELLGGCRYHCSFTNCKFILCCLFFHTILLAILQPRPKCTHFAISNRFDIKPDED